MEVNTQGVELLTIGKSTSNVTTLADCKVRHVQLRLSWTLRNSSAVNPDLLQNMVGLTH